MDKHPGVYLDTRLVWCKTEAPQMSLFSPTEVLQHLLDDAGDVLGVNMC